MINGYAVYRNESGYAPFRVDITDFANYGGANVLAVRVDATLGEGWFYEGAGIYRHVWLTKTDPLHVPQWGVFVRAVPRAGGADLLITTDVANEGEAALTCQLRSVVRDAEGAHRRRGRRRRLAAPLERRRQSSNARMSPARGCGRRRRPISTRCAPKSGSTARWSMRCRTPFGIRTIRFDAQQGFFLNGSRSKLLGTCNHQDHAGVGSALPDALQDFRIRKLKEMGSNAYRASHNPPTPELLDACDRLGMLVIDETRPMSSAPEGMDQLERLIRRDRNHPSRHPLVDRQRGAEPPGHVARRAHRALDAAAWSIVSTARARHRLRSTAAGARAFPRSSTCWASTIART